MRCGTIHFYGGITPQMLKYFKFSHPTLCYGGIIVLGYIFSVLTAIFGFFSWIPSLVFGVYLVTEARTRFHGVAIIVIGSIFMID
jgi:hypothetical protein